jgi:hypothetical protein
MIKSGSFDTVIRQLAFSRGREETADKIPVVIGVFL